MGKPEPIEQGDPRSPICRHCGKAKRVHRDVVLVCGECDLILPEAVIQE